jgi:hypothetical protein
MAAFPPISTVTIPKPKVQRGRHAFPVELAVDDAALRLFSIKLE